MSPQLQFIYNQITELFGQIGTTSESSKFRNFMSIFFKKFQVSQYDEIKPYKNCGNSCFKFQLQQEVDKLPITSYLLLMWAIQCIVFQNTFKLRFFLKKQQTNLIGSIIKMGCVTTKQSSRDYKQQKINPQIRNPRISFENYYMSNKVSSQNLRLQHSKYQQIQESKSSSIHDDAEVKNYFSQFLISEIQQEKHLQSPPFTPFDLLNKMQQQQTNDVISDQNEQFRISLKNLNKQENFMQCQISCFEL